jgi:hypothetical protein
VALATYEELVKAIADWVARADLVDKIPDFIRLFEGAASRDLDIREQETTVSANLIAGQDYIDLPLDCLWPRLLVIKSTPKIVPRIVSGVEFARFEEAHRAAGAPNPVVAVHEGNRIKLGAVPTAATPYDLWYMRGIPPLGDDRESNQVLVQAPDCYLYGSLLHTAPYLGSDDRLAVWASLYKDAARSYRMMNWRSRTGAGPLAMRPDFNPMDGHVRGR